MKLMTKALETKMPRMTKGKGRVYAHWFHPMSSWHWYGMEYDPERRDVFGLVKGHETELGYFNLTEMAGITPPIERDLYFEECSLDELMERLTNEKD